MILLHIFTVEYPHQATQPKFVDASVFDLQLYRSPEERWHIVVATGITADHQTCALCIRINYDFMNYTLTDSWTSKSIATMLYSKKMECTCPSTFDTNNGESVWYNTTNPLGW